jgi:predicted protein tyrosine phosphatase
MRVCSFSKALILAPGFDWVLSIVDPGVVVPPLSDLPGHHLILRFRDEEEDPFLVKEEIQKALDWGRGIPPGDSILVHCHAGVSRSPALATLLLIQQRWELGGALRYLHEIGDRTPIPNPLVLEIGLKLLVS